MGDPQIREKSRRKRCNAGRFPPFAEVSRPVRSLPALDVGPGALIAAPPGGIGPDDWFPDRSGSFQFRAFVAGRLNRNV
jgi:hypothetical protein